MRKTRLGYPSDFPAVIMCHVISDPPQTNLQSKPHNKLLHRRATTPRPSLSPTLPDYLSKSMFPSHQVSNPILFVPFRRLAPPRLQYPSAKRRGKTRLFADALVLSARRTMVRDTKQGAGGSNKQIRDRVIQVKWVRLGDSRRGVGDMSGGPRGFGDGRG